MQKLAVQNISKSYPSLDVLESFTFQLHEGEFLTILGPSGCGKSTLLQIISGLISPDRGEVFFEGKKCTSTTGLMSFMHQKDLLLPWKNVLENISIPLRLKGMSRKNARREASSHLGRFGLDGFEKYYPIQLSGGMRQRAALLRTYLYQSDVMLLDEPFGALDAITREGMQEWLLGIMEEVRTTVVLVTHAVEEALLLSDRILVLSPRPSVVKEEIAVPFPHPRDSSLRLSAEFLELKRRVLVSLD
ncbi:MAG: ABC transporter ATP-binding protein [Deltaproteobacteria bacterium]|nr:ABC transporter ATP-binding protein [Deltaproteobacteria bacterium]